MYDEQVVNDLQSEAKLTIGQRVKFYRKERGLSQDELAEGICSRQTISLLENGQHFPSVEFMRKIAERLGIPLHEIVMDQEQVLDTEIQVDIIKVYVETGEYANALFLIEEVEMQSDLLEHFRREIVICRAECLISLSRAGEAIEYLTSLQQKLEELREPDDHFMARLYDKLGTAYYFMSNISNAYAHYMRAYQLTLRFPALDVNAARIIYNLGMACRQLNRHLDAIEYLKIAESFFKSISDVKRLAQTIFEIGVTFRASQQYEQASQYLQESFALFKSMNNLYFARIVRESYAFTILSKEQPEQAIEEVLDCAREFEKENDIARLSVTYSRAANLLLEQGKLNDAGKYLHLALNRFTEEEAKSNFMFVTVYQVYAKYLLKIKEYEKCIDYCFKASEQFDKMGYSRDAAESLEPAIVAYQDQNMLAEALEISKRVNDQLRQVLDQNR